jgi:polyisoprenoid-binding protein YceI
MTRHIRISLLALAFASLSCQSQERQGTSEPEQAAQAVRPAAPPASEAEKSATGAPAAPTATLSLDPSASKFDFVAAKITRSHDGSFGQFTGTLALAGDEIHGVNFEVDTTSVRTDTDKLTEHVKSKDFLDVATYPKASFKSTSVAKQTSGPATHLITGALTLHGVTQEITFPVTVTSTPEAISGRGEISINRQKFGVIYPGMPDDLIKDEVILKPSFVFPKKKA